ncbi:hypothetical protein C3Y89_24340 [Rhizobium sp. UPM1132]|uniref:hypothetical protein n=1 Tax=Rhizobium ruizarguesonis TaxID=2081791 RepID=UPI0014463081|nr:hypothetical protein [Rhizobium ruizarguesonis]NKQ73435.1 hypothetical protein [Rhizobium ruizarguesonis]
MASFEEECIERYFLAPGSSGPIGSVYVADDHLLEIFGVAELEQARKQFIKSLPHVSILKSRFSGLVPPLKGLPPDYVKILVFLCWMQTTKMRQRGDRDFRQLLSKQLGEDFTGFKMNGLDMMWEHLKDFLWRVHGIELVLPEIIENIRRIGRTLQMAFPTWRDKAAFRKLRQYIPPDHLLDPLAIANRIHTSRYLLGDTMQSFEYNFEKFDMARKRGHREHEATPFWHAWYAVVAEQAAIEEIEVIESDFGGYELFRVPPVGDRVSISSPEEAAKLVPKPLTRLISKGLVFLDSIGFGRYRAQAVAETGIFLMSAIKFSQCDPAAIRSSAAINPDWVVATFRGKFGERTPPAASKRAFGWRNGIRIGSAAYLGRSPLTPSITGPLPEAIQVEAGGKPVSLMRIGDEMVLEPGIYSGTVTAHSLGASHEVLMVPRANEVGEVRRLAFDPSRYLSEDEFHYGKAPTTGTEFEIWSGERIDPCHELVTLGEALYERTARGLPLPEAIDIVRKAIALNVDRPSEWEILRSFFDAGWIEPTFLRHFPARRLLQNELGARSVGDGAVIICGPTPLAVVDRIAVAARAAGGTLETLNGASPWVLPRLVAHFPNDQSRRDFLRRAAIRELPQSEQAVADVADHGDPYGFRVVGKLKADRGFFNACFEETMTDGLYRLERPGSNSLFLHRSVVPGKQDQNYTSASVAILSHYLRLGSDVFLYDGSVMRSIATGVMLPSSWARWASDRALCNPGPSKRTGGWQYEYPAEDKTTEAIARLLPIRRQRDTAFGWRDRFLLSASNHNRKIYESRHRGIRMASAMHGKSK